MVVQGRTASPGKCSAGGVHNPRPTLLKISDASVLDHSKRRSVIPFVAAVGSAGGLDPSPGCASGGTKPAGGGMGVGIPPAHV